MKKITKYDGYIFIFLILPGILFNSLYLHFSWIFFVFLSGLGLCFEFGTEKLWDYNPDLRNSIFTFPGKDVNLLFGFGWASLIILSFSLSKFVQGYLHIKHTFIIDILSIGIVGNILEQFYYSLKLFVYNKKMKIFKIPFLGYRELWSIPLSVRLGYFLTTGLMIWFIVFLYNTYLIKILPF